MNASHFGLLAVGLVLLVAGADALVRGASRLALRFGISPLVIGLTVVAFGTSAPELSVSVQSSLAGQADLALGNAIGSNIFNVLLILGLCAVITPLSVHRQVIRVEAPIVLAATVLAWLLARDGSLGRADGAMLALALVGYLAFQVWLGRRHKLAESDEQAPSSPDSSNGHAGIDLAWIVAGLVGLVLGSRWLVQAAVAMAEALGVSPLVIGLTIVAGGTSLPELATSVVAAMRGQRDIAVGNVMGSNVFNLLGVLGTSALCSARGVDVVPGALAIDFPVLLASAAMCIPIFVTGHRIARPEGWLFLFYYAAYTTWLVLDAQEHPSREAFGSAIVWVAAPLSLALVGWSLGHWVFKGNRELATRPPPHA